MKSYGNMELDDQSSDSYASDDTSESDFEFDFDELELSDDDSNVYLFSKRIDLQFIYLL